MRRVQIAITGEPPEYGDPITAMRESYDSHKRDDSVCRRGDVFVRRHGSTEPATQEVAPVAARRAVMQAMAAMPLWARFPAPPRAARST